MRFFKIASIIVIIFSSIVIWAFYALLNSIQPHHSDTLPPHKFNYQRISDSPIITTESHPMLLSESESFGYKNINGPTLIKVPEWVENPLGRYYLYFAHHKGKYLRLAYADHLTGPWQVADPIQF